MKKFCRWALSLFRVVTNCGQVEVQLELARHLDAEVSLSVPAAQLSTEPVLISLGSSVRTLAWVSCWPFAASAGASRREKVRRALSVKPLSLSAGESESWEESGGAARLGVGGLRRPWLALSRCLWVPSEILQLGEWMSGLARGCSGGNYQSANLEEISGIGPHTRSRAHGVSSHVFYYVLNIHQ